MRAQLITGESIFELPEDEWNGLVERSMTNTPFQTKAYQKSWWLNLKPSGSELKSVIIRGNDNQLIAIACFYITNDGVINFNGCVEETDYLDIIVEAEFAELAWSLIFETLFNDNNLQWRLVELCNIPEISPSRNILAKIATNLGLALVESINEVCPVIELPSSFEDYLESLDSKQRREINRKLRRANGAGAQLHIVGSGEDLEQAVDEFLELLQKSTLEKRGWLNDGRRKLFHEVARAAQQSNSLMLSFVEIDGRKAAGLFNFDYQGRIWVYNSGLDPEAFGSLSLGVVLTAQAIAWAIEIGRQEFDFLRGNETYKYRFGAEDTKIYRVDITRRT